MVKINLFATFRLIAGIKSFDLDLPAGTSVISTIHRIVERYPILRSHWLDTAGELHAHVHVFVNGDDALTLPAGLDTPLRPGDTLDFFPPVAGGSL